MGTEGSTFVIDQEGKISRVVEKVAPKKHLELLLAALA